MSFVAEILGDWWFVHSATMTAAASELLDENGRPEGGWEDPIILDRCRLQDLTMDQLIEARTAGIERATSVLLVPLDTPSLRNSRISDVVFRPDHPRAGQEVASGPFGVVGVLTQRSTTDEYKQLLLERYG